MLTDLPIEGLRSYASSQTEPEDFTTFWSATLASAESHPIDLRVERVESVLSAVEVYDVTFAGFDGQPVRAWYRRPADVSGPLPTVVQYVGYGGGRGHAEESLLIAASGFGHFHMDTRGQGSSWGTGDTADSGPLPPQIPGVMTRGIRSPEDYYYRRLITDAVRAVDAAAALDGVDSDRIVLQGGSQGGGLALAVAGLRSDVAAVAAFVPFLCDFPRALLVTDAYPYREVGDYLRIHRSEVAEVHETLRYFDGVNFARHATAPAYVSAALMDPICPPSTVFGAYREYSGPKELALWKFNGHEGGAFEDERDALLFFRRTLGIAG